LICDNLGELPHGALDIRNAHLQGPMTVHRRYVLVAHCRSQGRQIPPIGLMLQVKPQEIKLAQACLAR
jgi:hypothetical protein